MESKNEFRFLNVKVNAVQPRQARDIVLSWFKNEKEKYHYISSTNINNVVIANDSAHYYDVIDRADLSLPDGVPLLWFGRLLGFKLKKRCGIEELMVELFEMSNEGVNFKHYFYGTTDETLRDLRKALNEKYPNLEIAGMVSPPFRKLSAQENDAYIDAINEAKPDFLWVGLGCPKQETWLYDNRDKLKVTVGGGAGAVFDFISGNITKAPQWIQYLGLEWLFRLSKDPGRLWKRYLVRYPKVFLYACKLATK